MRHGTSSNSLTATDNSLTLQHTFHWLPMRFVLFSYQGTFQKGKSMPNTQNGLTNWKLHDLLKIKLANIWSFDYFLVSLRKVSFKCVCFFSSENCVFLSFEKASAKKMSVHSTVAFCSGIAIFDILLCARLEGVAAFKAPVCKCPHLHPSSAKIDFLCILQSIYTQKRKAK